MKWDLTPSGLTRLMARLDADPVRAGEQYEQLRRALQRFFRWQGDPDPDFCADDTLDRLARRLDQGQTIDDVASFALGVARMVRLERRRLAAQRPPLVDEGAAGQLAAPEPAAHDPAGACLQTCLDALPPDDRALILRYYVGERRLKIDGRLALARELGLSDNALRHRAQRLRERLKTCARACLEGRR